MLGDDRAQLPDEPPAGRRSAGVHDPAPRVTALEPEREAAVAVGVEANAEPGEVGDRVGRLLAQHARRRLANGVAAGRDRVEQVALGAVVGRHRGGEAALGPPARGLGERRRGHERDARTCARGAHGRVQPGGAGAHHRDLSGENLHVARYRTPMASAPVWLEHPSSLLHDTGAHPEQPARIVAIERELSARDWLGFERVTSPAVDRAVLEAVHSAAYVASIERACAAGGGHLDADTVVSEGSFEAALHAAGGAVRMVDLLLDGDAPSGFSAHRPPGHHALTARAMGFCLFNNIAVAARYAIDARGARARDDRRLGRPPRQRHQRHLPRDRRGAVRLDPPVAAVSRARGRRPTSARGTAAGSRSTCRCAPGADDRAFCSLVDHVVVPLARRSSRSSCWSRPDTTPTATTRSAQCEVTEDGYAAMTRSIRWVCESLGDPVGCVLEGGYALGALARSVAATLAGAERSRSERSRPARTRAPATAWRPSRSKPASGSRSGGRCSPEPASPARSRPCRPGTVRGDGSHGLKPRSFVPSRICDGSAALVVPWRSCCRF